MDKASARLDVDRPSNPDLSRTQMSFGVVIQLSSPTLWGKVIRVVSLLAHVLQDLVPPIADFLQDVVDLFGLLLGLLLDGDRAGPAPDHRPLPGVCWGGSRQFPYQQPRRLSVVGWAQPTIVISNANRHTVVAHRRFRFMSSSVCVQGLSRFSIWLHEKDRGSQVAGAVWQDQHPPKVNRGTLCFEPR